jgi:signal transduction histidine kinase
MIGPSIVLLLAGCIMAFYAARQVERPLFALRQLVLQAKGEISTLSEQLLGLQEDERQRIARELHDSTAQGLVAASLGLVSLQAKLRDNDAAQGVIAQVADQLEAALQELRVFSYLLHPPRLDLVGLKATLEEFIDGFAARTGLQSRTTISGDIDQIPPEIQHSVLRVVQEALANIRRHSGAGAVVVDAKIRTHQLFVRVCDNGRGINAEPLGRNSRPRMGVGIPGMRARLQQFGGDLRIRSGIWGTCLVARVPLPKTKESFRV